jgi:hypothetical protein
MLDQRVRAGAAAVATAGLVLSLAAAVSGAGKPAPEIKINDLFALKGPTPPQGAKHKGVESNPKVGDVYLPLKNVDVYELKVRDLKGNERTVQWTWVPNHGNYLWADVPVACGEGHYAEKGGFAMQIKLDGTGSYILGSNRCPVGRAWGCQFDANAQPTACGMCAWSGDQITCTQSE